MAKVYFHLRDGPNVVSDAEGSDIPLTNAAAQALAKARALIADDALQGVINLKQRIEVEDSTGDVIHTLLFSDAVRIIT